MSALEILEQIATNPYHYRTPGIKMLDKESDELKLAISNKDAVLLARQISKAETFPHETHVIQMLAYDYHNSSFVNYQQKS